jgi:hypothetical protein
VQIGLEFFVLFAIINVALFFNGLSFKRMYAKPTRQPYTSVFVALFSLLWQLSAYLAALLAPSDYFHTSLLHKLAFIALLACALGAYIVVNMIVDAWKLGNPSLLIALGTGILIVFVLLADYLVLWELLRFANPSLIAIFGVLCFLFSLLLARLQKRLDEDLGRFAHVGYGLIFGAGLTAIYFLALVSYSYGIFPYVPHEKGGADFTQAPRTTVTFTPQALDSLSPSVVVDSVIVYGDSASIVVALIDKHSDACKWQRLDKRPTLLQIPRSQIRSMTSTPLNAGETNCCNNSQGSAPRGCYTTPLNPSASPAPPSPSSTPPLAD